MAILLPPTRRSAPEIAATLPGTAMQLHGYRYASFASRFGMHKNAERWNFRAVLNPKGKDYRDFALIEPQ
jgi:hypothetical protein